MFQYDDFCRNTRLMTNVIFLLLKDQIQIYRLYHNHIAEVIERFPTLSLTEIPQGLTMLENFVKLTEAFKFKGKQLLFMFNFPLTFPKLYEPDQEQIEELRTIVNMLSS